MKRIAFSLFVVLTALAAPVGTTSAGTASKRGSGAAPVLDDERARRAGLSQQEVTDATRLYKTKCMRCHKSYDPNEYSQQEWSSWMGKMRKKAHLAAGQESLLTRYLGAYRGDGLVAKTNTTARNTSESRTAAP